MALTRNCFAARNFGPHKSILFLFAVTIDRDEDTGLFESTIVGLEHSVGATAETPNEATQRAMRCLTSIVDDAIERRVGLRDVLAHEAIKVVQAQVSLDDVVKMITVVGTRPSGQESWRLTDESPITTQLEAVLV